MERARQNDNNSKALPRPNQRREKWTNFLGFSAFAIFALYAYFAEPASADETPWFVLAIILFPVLAVISGFGLLKGWSLEETARIETRVLIGVPLIVAGFLMVAWGAVSFFNWLASIPSWAAVIIVLLLIIISRQR